MVVQVRRAGATALAVSLMAAAAACGSSGTSSGSSTSGPGTTTKASAPLPYAATMKTAMDETMKQLLVVGAAAFVSTPDGSFTWTYGNRTLGGNDPVQITDHARIGSNTKTMTGTVILQLAQEGKLSVDDPVSKYRPDVPNGENITIAQLMNMRSGLFNYTEALDINESLDKTPQRVWKPDELIAIGLRNPPYFAPGQGYHYSNTNTVLEGVIIEKVTGNPLRTEFENRIFKPLGMTGTDFPELTSNQIPPVFARGYMYGTNVETIKSLELPPEQQAAAKAGTLKPNDATDQNPSWAWAAGSASSSVGDLVTYAQALVDGRLLGPEMQAKRLASVQPTNPSDPKSTQYGWNLAKLGPMYGHTGELPGYNSIALYDPEKKVTVVVWASPGSAPDGTPTAITVARDVIIPTVYANPIGSGSGGTTVANPTYAGSTATTARAPGATTR